uniref:BTB domain-containing protein n=1 Tax=Strongyloides stercoralis TaxID=6248 RepID=A0A0K0E8P8_STRER
MKFLDNPAFKRINFVIVLNNKEIDQVFVDFYSSLDKCLMQYSLSKNIIFMNFLKTIMNYNTSIFVYAITATGEIFTIESKCTDAIIEKIFNMESIMLVMNISIFEKKDMDFIYIEIEDNKNNNFFIDSVKKETNKDNNKVEMNDTKSLQDSLVFESDIFNIIKQRNKQMLPVFKIENVPVDIFFELLYYQKFTLNNNFKLFLKNNILLNATINSICTKDSLNVETKKLNCLDQFLVRRFNHSIKIGKKEIKKINEIFKMKKIDIELVKKEIIKEINKLENFENKFYLATKNYKSRKIYSQDEIERKQKIIFETVKIFNQQKQFLQSCLNECNIFIDKHVERLHNFLIEIRKKLDIIKIIQQNYEKKNITKELISTKFIEQNKLQDEFKVEVENYLNIFEDKKNKFNFIINSNRNAIRNSIIILQKANDIERNSKYIISCKDKIEKLILNNNRSNAALNLKNFLNSL